MLLDLQSITSALGLVSSLAKPLPVVGGVVSGVVDTVDGILDSTLGTVDSTLNGLLGGILAVAVDGDSGSPSASASASDALASSTSTAWSSEPTSIPGAVANLSCPFATYSPGDLTVEPFAAYDPAAAVVYRYRQQQAVNLGSWFVQEEWMNPSLFTCASGPAQAELDVATGWGGAGNARQVLERHWDEWITEDDFAHLADIGINTVRLPIGYWSLGPVYCLGTPFEPVADVYTNSWARVVRAINWAAKYEIGVLVDLHGAPGSQNGQAHSGVSDGVVGLFNNATNVGLTLDVLTYLTQQLVNVNNIVGIELLNEPSNDPTLPAFYDAALSRLRQVSPEAAYFPFYIQDAFDMTQYAQYIANRTDFLVLDHHSYFVFGDAASQEVPAKTLAAEMAPASGSVSEQLLAAAALERGNLIVGEWSCALSSDALANSSDPAYDRMLFCTGQMEAYANATAGWAFWSYKTESCSSDDNWCFTNAVGTSLPPTFYSYPNASYAQMNGTYDTSYLLLGAAAPAATADDMLTALDASAQLDTVKAALSAGAAGPAGGAPKTPATVPSSRAASLRRALGFNGAPGAQQQRFAVVAARRSRRDTMAVTYSAEQVAISRGYEDGLKAAQTFAASNGSRLGFIGQFIEDALTAMDGEIAPENEDYYRSWFRKGLANGEMQVMQGQSSAEPAPSPSASS